MLEIYPLSCYTHPFQHWLGLIWLEFSLHPASDLIWRHDLWPSIVFGLICFGFLLFFPLRKLWALFSSCFINLISDLKWNLWQPVPPLSATRRLECNRTTLFSLIRNALMSPLLPLRPLCSSQCFVLPACWRCSLIHGVWLDRSGGWRDGSVCQLCLADDATLHPSLRMPPLLFCLSVLHSPPFFQCFPSVSSLFLPYSRTTFLVGLLPVCVISCWLTDKTTITEFNWLSQLWCIQVTSID